MLAKPYPYQALTQLRARQRGVVLLITLIVLVAMTLATIAMVRSVDTGNIIAGNLAFQQAATHSGDIGSEVAMQWLQTNSGGTVLYTSQSSTNPKNGYGYSSKRNPAVDDPQANQSWDTFWGNSLNAFKATVSFTVTGGSYTPNPAGPAPSNAVWVDAAGNTIEYVIHRLCLTPGDPTQPATQCSTVPPQLVTTSAANNNSLSSTATLLQPNDAYYYRITSRITGPNNSISYVQTIVAL